MLNRVFLSFAALFISANLVAAEATFPTTVQRVLVDDSRYAGCMVLLEDDPAQRIPTCGQFWVTLDCLNLFPESVDGISQVKLSQAQLALVSGRGVTVRVTDRRVANGYCFAQRFDVK